MAMSKVGLVVVVKVLCLVMVAAMSTPGAAGQRGLRSNFYDKSCPQIYSIVKAEVQKPVKVEKRMAASLVRLHFHDCFVNGCDGSVLLDDTPTFKGEKTATGNNNSLRGFEVVDSIKAALEKACPRTVSCADILALACRDSAVEVGLTENYPVLFGRRDSLTANISEANARLPAPGSNYTELKTNFAFQKLDETDLVALSGAHTIGRVRCFLVRLFIAKQTNAAFNNTLNKACPEGGKPDVLQNLDARSADLFDNNYYKNLQERKGILPSDQTLFNTEGAGKAMVKEFAQNQDKFFKQFARSSIKMGNIANKPQRGEIRKNCRVVNSRTAVAFE